MRPRGAALAESTAAAMGGTAADGVGEFEREGVRRVVPDGRADAADGRVCESEAVGASASVSCPAKAGHPVLRAPSVQSQPPRRTGSPACAGDDSNLWDNLFRSHDQISCEPQDFLMPDAVAFFALHHMMIIILYVRHRKESPPWPKPPIPSSSSPPSVARSAASWASSRRFPHTSSVRT